MLGLFVYCLLRWGPLTPLNEKYPPERHEDFVRQVERLIHLLRTADDSEKEIILGDLRQLIRCLSRRTRRWGDLAPYVDDLELELLAQLEVVLTKMLAKLKAGKAASLPAFLSGWIYWKARTRARRKTVSLDEGEDTSEVPEPSVDPRAATEARQLYINIVRHLHALFPDDENLVRRVLEGLMSGESVSEVAARLGISRQRIYRILEKIRTWLGSDHERSP